MPAFKDLTGRNWSFKVDLNVLEEVKESTGFNLMKLIDVGRSNAIDTLSDPVELLRVLVALCKPDANGVPLTKFKADISDGDVLEKAADALLNSVIDFLPRQQKLMMQSAASITRDAKPELIGAAQMMLNKSRPEIEKAIVEMRRIAESSSSGSSVPSPVSIPEPTASET